MSLYELTPPLLPEDPGTGSLHPRNPFRKTRARLASHFSELISDIDAALQSSGWSSDRTGFATTEFAQALPTPTIAAVQEPPLALRTFERVRDMLGFDDQQTAALVGISRNTPRDWRNGNQPRAATTRRLYELSGVLDLVATQQPDGRLDTRCCSRWSHLVAVGQRERRSCGHTAPGPRQRLDPTPADEART